MRLGRLKRWLAWIVAARWTAAITLVLLIADASLLPPSALPKQLDGHTHCYFPWQLPIDRVGNSLALAPTTASLGDIQATFDVRLPQSSLLWPTSIAYSTVIADWDQSTGAPVSPAKHAQVRSLVIAYLDSIPSMINSEYLRLLKTRGEGRFTKMLPLGYLHNAAALLAFGLLLISGTIQIRRLTRAGRRAEARRRGVCYRCGYLLEGCPGPICPECGTDQR